MPSPFCPKCGGSGLVVKCYFIVPCVLCKANDIGNNHLTWQDYLSPDYWERMALVEGSRSYWDWLNTSVLSGQINPNTPQHMNLLEEFNRLIKQADVHLSLTDDKTTKNKKKHK